MAGPGQGRTIRLINVRIVRHGRIVEGPGTELWVQNGKVSPPSTWMRSSLSIRPADH